jgi:hypothetical protein
MMVELVSASYYFDDHRTIEVPSECWPRDNLGERAGRSPAFE